jgi:hypothetical protein
MCCTAFRAALAFAFGVAVIGRAEATPFIPDRATLETILQGGVITEDFERYLFTTSTLNDLVGSSLSSQTITTSFAGNPSPQGPGLVVDGVEFYGDGFLWWTQAGAGGWESQAIYSGGHIFSMVDTINIRFTQPTTTFGVDVVALFGVSPEMLTATVFAPDLQTVLGTTEFVLDGPTAPVFVGFGDPGGIGLVQLRTSRRFVSPAIDNLAFGPAQAVIPEPATAVLLTSGLAAAAALRRRGRKKSIYGSGVFNAVNKTDHPITMSAVTSVACEHDSAEHRCEVEGRHIH